MLYKQQIKCRAAAQGNSAFSKTEKYLTRQNPQDFDIRQRDIYHTAN